MQRQLDKEQETRLIKELEAAGLSAWHIVEVRLGIYMGLSREEILSYAKADFKIEDMERRRMELQFGRSVPGEKSEERSVLKLEQLQLVIAQAVDRLGEHISQALSACQDKTGIIQLTDRLAALQYENKVLKDRLRHPDPEDEKTKRSFWDKFIPKKEKAGTDITILELLSHNGKQYNDAQIAELSAAWETGLSMDAILNIADPEISAEKMRQLRRFAASLEGLSEDPDQPGRVLDPVLSEEPEEIMPEEQSPEEMFIPEKAESSMSMKNIKEKGE